MQQPPQDHLSTLSNRVESLSFKAEGHERAIEDIRKQLQDFVRTRENELLLLNLQTKMAQVERGLDDEKREIIDIKTSMTTLDIKIQQAKTEAEQRQDKLQIRVLWGIVSFALAVLTGFLIAYFTHLIH